MAGARLGGTLPNMIEVMDLAGGWQARWFDGWRGGQPHRAERTDSDARRWMQVAVPGEIHLDLMREGIIPDPCLAGNVLACRWVEEQQWSFRRVIHLPEPAPGQRTFLVFDRLELVARVVLNGQEIARHANAFLPLRCEITAAMRAGDNLLVVHLESGLYAVADKQAQGYLGFQDQLLHKRHWLRAPQCQFGWDWAPRLINVGITAPVRLESTRDDVRLAGMTPLVELSGDLRRGTVRLRVHLDGLAAGATAVQLEAAIKGTASRALCEIQLQRGASSHQLELTLDAPTLWWPVGTGASHRYTLELRCRWPGGEASKDCRIGFRRARFSREPASDGGERYVLEINNRKVFAKGANLVPADLIRARIDKQRYATLIERARECHMNLLRVWGGGLYEADDFYELCDEQGILVWQEFIFDCGRYPGNDQAFWESVRDEATYQVRRLAGHPSLIAWCGNNENEWGAWEWGFDKGVVLPDHAIPHHLLPRILAQEDPGRHYQPSSPWSPSGHPNRDDAGDQHPWATTMADGEFRAFRAMTCRFPNEGGMLGPTALATVRECLGDGEQRVGSHAFAVHDNATESWHEPLGIDTAFTTWLGLDPCQLSIERWVYYAGLLQGEGLREYCDAFRRRMFDSAAAVFWMFNDTWPASRSWTVVDYRLRRTPAFASVRRALQPVSLVVAIVGEEVHVVGVNDTDQRASGHLRAGILRLTGGQELELELDTVLEANAATLLARFPLARWTRPTCEVAFAELRNAEGGLIARHRLIQPRFVEMQWPRAEVAVELHAGIARFTSAVFAWGVCLDLDGEEPLEDNLFDCWPGVPYEMAWQRPTPPRILHIGNLVAAG